MIEAPSLELCGSVLGESIDCVSDPLYHSDNGGNGAVGLDRLPFRDVGEPVSVFMRFETGDLRDGFLVLL